MPEKLAYYLCEDEDDCSIAFLSRKDYLKYLDDEYEITRTPQYDSYAEQDFVPYSVLLEHGWHFFCNECGKEVTSEAWDYEEDEPLEMVVLDRLIFCSHSCHESWNKKREYYKLEKQKWLDFLLASFPDITNVSVIVGTEETHASFLIPNCKYKINWYSSEKTTLNCSRIDAETVKNYLSGIDAIAL